MKLYVQFRFRKNYIESNEKLIDTTDFSGGFCNIFGVRSDFRKKICNMLYACKYLKFDHIWKPINPRTTTQKYTFPVNCH